MRQLLLLLLFQAVYILQAFSLSNFPPDMLVGKTYAQRYFYIEAINEKFLPEEDSIHFFSRISEIKKLGIENNDRELELEAELLKLSYFFHHRNTDSVLCFGLLEQLFSLAHKERNTIMLARLNNMAGNYFWGKNYELAFEYYHAEYDIIKNMGVEKYPAKQRSIYYLGDCYWFFRDYPHAVRYLTEAFHTDVFGQSLYYTLQATNTVGLCYQKMGNLDSADYYFMRANAIAVTVGNNAWEGITSGNLGYDYFLRGDYDTASVLLQKDIDLSVQRGDWGCASGSLISIAEINLAKGKIKLAAQQAEQAYKWVQLSGEYGRLKSLYTLLSKLYEKQGNNNLAALYNDSAALAKDSQAQKFAALQVLRLKEKDILTKKRKADEFRRSFTDFAFHSVAIAVIIIFLLIVRSIYISSFHKISLKE